MPFFGGRYSRFFLKMAWGFYGNAGGIDAVSGIVFTRVSGCWREWLCCVLLIYGNFLSL